MIFAFEKTGKTFMWTVILAYFRSLGKIVLAVAASGIASRLLPSGRTAHSRFNIPIDLSSKTSYDIKKKTLLADLLRQTSLIIWDEAPMSDRRYFDVTSPKSRPEKTGLFMLYKNQSTSFYKNVAEFVPRKTW
uniref:ATP-dependent DNA helicase n=1 Tax=Lactuca sativa TaxID=4236 RepID=A0A9R1XPG1_LACSA|nr:hypothetical protein LSAT_V11C200088820 [Lactuca sativa]